MKKQKIKIISGHSGPGGSTQIWINLTNLFNENGYDCTFYGPQKFHLNKCKADNLNNVTFDPDDIILTHVLHFKNRPEVKKCIYVCHEKWWGVIKDDMKYWDIAVFNHQNHKDYHKDYTGPYVLIPNPKSKLEYKEKPDKDLIAGVIGTVEDRKQTHISIKQALQDGCTKVYVCGACNRETPYYQEYMRQFERDERVVLIDYVHDKQAMYDSIGRVYHISKGEVACLVKDECYQTGTIFFGNEETSHEVSPLNNDEILKLWENLWT